MTITNPPPRISFFTSPRDFWAHLNHLFNLLHKSNTLNDAFSIDTCYMCLFFGRMQSRLIVDRPVLAQPLSVSPAASSTKPHSAAVVHNNRVLGLKAGRSLVLVYYIEKGQNNIQVTQYVLRWNEYTSSAAASGNRAGGLSAPRPPNILYLSTRMQTQTRFTVCWEERCIRSLIRFHAKAQGL